VWRLVWLNSRTGLVQACVHPLPTVVYHDRGRARLLLWTQHAALHIMGRSKSGDSDCMAMVATRHAVFRAAPHPHERGSALARRDARPPPAATTAAGLFLLPSASRSAGQPPALLFDWTGSTYNLPRPACSAPSSSRSPRSPRPRSPASRASATSVCSSRPPRITARSRRSTSTCVRRVYARPWRCNALCAAPDRPQQHGRGDVPEPVLGQQHVLPARRPCLPYASHRPHAHTRTG
jgi:hypothetical protein